MKNEKMKEILDFFRNNKKKTCIGAGAGVAVIAVCVAVGITLGNGAKTTASNTGTQTQTETTTETAETETTLQMPLEENTVPEVTQLINQLRYFRHGIFFQRHLQRCLRFRCLCRRFRLRLCSSVRSCRLCTVSERDADRNTYRNYCNTCACTNTGLFLVIPKKIQNFFHLFVLHTFRSFLRTLFAHTEFVSSARRHKSRD